MLDTQAGCFLGFSALVRAYQIPLTTPDASPFTLDFDKLVVDTLDRWNTLGILIAVVAPL